MKPHWVIEQNIFSETIFENILKALKEEGNDYSLIRVLPFDHTIVDKVPKIPKDQPVVVYGSIGCQDVAKQYNWLPGVWTGSQFNCENYKRQLGFLYLNCNGFKCKISELNKLQVPLGSETLFIRPNEDTKLFAGEVLDRSALVEWYQKLKSIGYLDENDFDIWVAPTTEIQNEYRVVVVDGNIASWSGYKKQGRTVTYGSATTGALQCAQEAISRFKPAPVFVIDIAKTEFDYKVIEYNTFNSAGLYACNVKNIIVKINQYLEKQ